MADQARLRKSSTRVSPRAGEVFCHTSKHWWCLYLVLSYSHRSERIQILVLRTKDGTNEGKIEDWSDVAFEQWGDRRVV